MTDLDIPDNGLLAHSAGHPISACPYAPGDPCGASWRADWIRAEAAARGDAGTFGVSDEDYTAMGLQPPRRPSGKVVWTTPIQAIKGLHNDLVIIDDAVRQFADAFGVPVYLISDPSGPSRAQRRAKPAPAKPGNHRPCPLHGPTASTGGICRSCTRRR